MLFGRERESARIAEVLDAARARRSGALVVRGEAGIGKSALLNEAIERADGMRVLRARGVESPGWITPWSSRCEETSV
jgi:predicted ATPase